MNKKNKTNSDKYLLSEMSSIFIIINKYLNPESEKLLPSTIVL